MNRDLVVALIGRALSTGMPKSEDTGVRDRLADRNWVEARSQAFGEAAAIAAHHIFQVDLLEAKRLIQLHVRDLRATLSGADLRDGGRVGKEATEIFEVLIDAR